MPKSKLNPLGLEFDLTLNLSMVPQRKIDQVRDLTQKLKGSKAVYLVDYRGLTGNQMVELRQRVRESGGQLQVAKNTLLARVLLSQRGDLDSASREMRGSSQEMTDISEPTAVVWAESDQIAPLKAVVKFAKEAGAPRLKLGLIEDRVLSAREAKELAKLPGMEVLRGQLVGMLSSPTWRLVGALRGNLQKLVVVLKEVQSKAQSYNQKFS